MNDLPNTWDKLRALTPEDEAVLHHVTDDDPLGRGPICCACKDDWPCDFERGRAAGVTLRSEGPGLDAPSLDEGLLALALYEVDGFGLLSECRERARDIASVYRRLAQEGETP